MITAPKANAIATGKIAAVNVPEVKFIKLTGSLKNGVFFTVMET